MGNAHERMKENIFAVLEGVAVGGCLLLIALNIYAMFQCFR